MEDFINKKTEEREQKKRRLEFVQGNETRERKNENENQMGNNKKIKYFSYFEPF